MKRYNFITKKFYKLISNFIYLSNYIFIFSNIYIFEFLHKNVYIFLHKNWQGMVRGDLRQSCVKLGPLLVYGGFVRRLYE
nr:MAG TPA: hypothetical protein [Caudoviricetes sp.]